jgi:hypothetical protein
VTLCHTRRSIPTTNYTMYTISTLLWQFPAENSLTLWTLTALRLTSLLTRNGTVSSAESACGKHSNCNTACRLIFFISALLLRS